MATNEEEEAAAESNRSEGLGSGGPAKRSGLGKYGPLAAIAGVAVLVVGVSVVLGGGDDDDDEPASAAATGEFPDGVITWEMAEAEGLDVDFGEHCDPETGLVAVPFFFRPQCVVADEENRDPNYSEDSIPGITEDQITVVAWLPDPNDAAFNLFQEGLGSDASPQDIRATYEGLVEVFETHYETYGRSIDLEFVQASGDTLDSTVARADAREAASYDPFLVLGGPLAATAWTEELQARDIPCFGCAGVRDPGDSVFTITPEGWQVNEHVTRYVEAKLAGHAAEFAGDDLASEERVFGHLRMANNAHGREDGDELDAMLAEAGIDVAATFVYDLGDLGAAQELSTSAISQFQQAGVTSVLAFGEPILFPNFTAEATAQDYYPEWILPGQPLVDMNAFGRNMDQDQWANAFGLSYLPPAAPPELNPAYQLYEWYHGEPPPAEANLLLIYPQVAMAFTALQYAGPDLTHQSALDGAYAFPPTPRSITQPSVYYGLELWEHWDDPQRPDHGGIDDMVEIWWDPEAEIRDEAGNVDLGAYRYVNGGQRYYADEYDAEISVFDPEGSPSEITDVPPEEQPPEYPPPR